MHKLTNTATNILSTKVWKYNVSQPYTEWVNNTQISAELI